MLNDVLRFINKFKELHPSELEDAFLHGNCYWFAKILADRFHGVIYYLPINNHFITYIGMQYYDISGKVIPDEEAVRWSSFQLIEPFEADRIKRDCINWD